MSRSTHAVPAVSIGMPVYNGEPFVTEAIDTLLAQTHEDFELIISDNASTDGTPELCRDAASRDSRVVYVRNRINLGFVRNFNQVFTLSRAPLFKWAAADDVHDPRFVEACLEVMADDPSIVLAHPRTVPIDENNEPITDKWVHPGVRGDRHDFLEYTNTTGAHSVSSPDPVERFQRIMEDIWFTVQLYGVIRADALAATALHAFHRMGDHILLSELVLHGRFVDVDEPLFLRRYHDNQTTNAPDPLAQLRLSMRDLTKEPTRARMALSYPNRLKLHTEAVDRAPLTPEQRSQCKRIIAQTLVAWGRMQATRRLGTRRGAENG